MQWLNHYSLNNSNGFDGTYPMNSDLISNIQPLNNWGQDHTFQTDEKEQVFFYFVVRKCSLDLLCAS